MGVQFFIAGRIVARWALGLPLGSYAVLVASARYAVREPPLSDDKRSDAARLRDDAVVAFAADAAEARATSREPNEDFVTTALRVVVPRDLRPTPEMTEIEARAVSVKVVVG